MFDLTRFGRLVRHVRRSRTPKLTQIRLAEEIGITQSFVSDLENGKLVLGPRDQSILEKISLFLDIPMEDAGFELSRLDPSSTFGYLPPASPPNSLQEKIRSGKRVITMEIHPPKGVGLKRFEREANEIREYADSVNVTDNQRALLKLSPIASSRILLELGIEPICQMTCRDKNRLALQADILSGYVLGVRNFFIIMGDPPEIGDHPDAQPVFDLHSVQALQTASKLRSGYDMAGNRLNKAPRDIFLGSACNPFPLDLAVELSKVRAKIRAGAEFFQTQPVYDIEGFKKYHKAIKSLGVRIIAGYIPILDRQTLDILSEIPGVHFPEPLKMRLENSSDIESEGLSIARDTVLELLEIAGGVHLMNISSVQPSIRVLSSIKKLL
ncbi:MAG: methylenetetrahydrofolate reductase [bacterium]